MSDQNNEQVLSTAERLASAAEALDRVLAKLDAQQEALNAKVDRIVAAVEESEESGDIEASAAKGLQQRVSELEKANAELKAQAARMTRKTLSPLVSAVVSKSSSEDERIDAGALDKTLQALSVEQRIAVKAEMARAGIIE